MLPVLCPFVIPIHSLRKLHNIAAMPHYFVFADITASAGGVPGRIDLPAGYEAAIQQYSSSPYPAPCSVTGGPPEYIWDFPSMDAAGRFIDYLKGRIPGLGFQVFIGNAAVAR